MPWKIKDVDKFKKGLDAEQKKEWVKIANRVLKSELKKDTGELEAEIIAIRTANNTFSESVYAEMSEYKDAIHKMNLGEISDNEYQLVLPVGTHYDDWYGDIIITETYINKLVDNQGVLKNVSPSLNSKVAIFVASFSCSSVMFFFLLSFSISFVITIITWGRSVSFECPFVD